MLGNGLTYSHKDGSNIWRVRHPEPGHGVLDRRHGDGEREQSGPEVYR